VVVRHHRPVFSEIESGTAFGRHKERACGVRCHRTISHVLPARQWRRDTAIFGTQPGRNNARWSEWIVEPVARMAGKSRLCPTFPLQGPPGEGDPPRRACAYSAQVRKPAMTSLRSGVKKLR